MHHLKVERKRSQKTCILAISFGMASPNTAPHHGQVSIEGWSLNERIFAVAGALDLLDGWLMRIVKRIFLAPAMCTNGVC